MARQGTGWNQETAQEVVTFTCEGCNQRFPLGSLFPVLGNIFTVCSHACIVAAAQQWKRLRNNHAVCVLVGLEED